MTSKPQLNLVTGWHRGREEWCCPDGELSCRLLQTEPLRLFSDRRMWPSHLCTDVLESFLNRWARDHDRAVRPTVREHRASREWWIHQPFLHHTLPVGHDAILEAAWTAPYECALTDKEWDLIREHGSNAVQLAIFEGDETAALILVVKAGTTKVELFFLVEWIECGRGEREIPIMCRVPSEVKVRLAGSFDDARRLIDNATDWWTKTMAGYKISTVGRPRLDVDHAMDRIRNELAAYRAEFGHAPKRDVFLRHIGMSERTWKRYMSRAQTNWRTLIETS